MLVQTATFFQIEFLAEHPFSHSMQGHHASVTAVLVLVSLLGVSAQPTKCLVTESAVAAEGTPISKAVDTTECCSSAGTSGTPQCIRYCTADNTVWYQTVDKYAAELMLSVAEGGGTSMGKAHFVCDTDDCNVKIEKPCEYVAPSAAAMLQSGTVVSALLAFVVALACA